MIKNRKSEAFCTNITAQDYDILHEPKMKPEDLFENYRECYWCEEEITKKSEVVCPICGHSVCETCYGKIEHPGCLVCMDKHDLWTKSTNEIHSILRGKK